MKHDKITIHGPRMTMLLMILSGHRGECYVASRPTSPVS